MIQPKRKLPQNLDKLSVNIEETGLVSTYFQIFDIKDIYGKGIHTITMRGSTHLKRGTNIRLEIIDENGYAIPINIPPLEGFENKLLPVRRFTFEVDDTTANGVGKIVLVGTLKDGQTVRFQRSIVFNPALRTQGYVDRDEWIDGEFYNIGDVVQFGGSSFVTILSHESDNSNQPPNATYWKVFSSAGITLNLTSEAHVVPFDNGIGDYTGAFTSASVFRGTEDITHLTSFSTGSKTTNFDGVFDGSTFTLTSIPNNSSGYVEIVATFESSSISKYYNVSAISSGADGNIGLSLLYKGLWDAGTTYQSTPISTDVVLYSSSYYYVKTGSVVSLNDAPIGSTWNEFDGQFKSIATDILLAQDVTIRRQLTMGDATQEANPYGASGVIMSLGGYDSNGNITFVQNNIDKRFYRLDYTGIYASSGSIGGYKLQNNRLFSGTGAFNNSNTPLFMDSNTGGFSLGDKLSFTSSTLTIEGNIIVTGGNASTVDYVNTVSSSVSSSVTTYVNSVSASVSSSVTNYINSVSSSVDTTIGTLDERIFTDANGLINKVPNPTGDGLFLGSTNLGYYSGGRWITYMDNQGDFYLTSSNGFLSWNSTTGALDIKGSINATSGTISGNLTVGDSSNGFLLSGSNSTMVVRQAIGATTYDLIKFGKLSSSELDIDTLATTTTNLFTVGGTFTGSSDGLITASTAFSAHGSPSLLVTVQTNTSNTTPIANTTASWAVWNSLPFTAIPNQATYLDFSYASAVFGSYKFVVDIVRQSDNAVLYTSPIYTKTNIYPETNALNTNIKHDFSNIVSDTSVRLRFKFWVIGYSGDANTTIFRIPLVKNENSVLDGSYTWNYTNASNLTVKIAPNLVRIGNDGVVSYITSNRFFSMTPESAEFRGDNVQASTGQFDTLTVNELNAFQLNVGSTSTTLFLDQGQVRMTAEPSVPTVYQNRVIVSDGSGILTASSITSTLLGYLSNVSSDIQSQLNSKVPSSRTLTFTSTQYITSSVVSAQDLSVDRSWNFTIRTGSINGTSNQINISGASFVVGDNITFSLPQNIHTDATPTFDTLTLGTSNAEGHLVFTRNDTNFIRASGASGKLGFIVGGVSATDLNSAFLIFENGTSTFRGSTTVTGSLTTTGVVILGTQATTTSHAVRADRSITINGTANQIISSAGSQNLTSDRTWTLSLPQSISTSSNVQFANIDSSGNVVIQGNLTVLGTQVIIDTEIVEIEDPTLLLNKSGSDASANGSGIHIFRVGTYGSIVYDATKTSLWKAGALGSEVELVNISGTQTLTNKTWNSNTITVPYGGTGLTSLTSFRIPYGNGTGAFLSSDSLRFNGTDLIVTGSAIIDNLTFNGQTISTTTGNIVMNPTTHVDFKTTTLFSASLSLNNGVKLLFNDTRGIYPTSTDSAFEWNLNNDNAKIYAMQPASDQIDFVFKISDNVATTDRFVFWIDSHLGAVADAYPLYMDGERVVFNYPSWYGGGLSNNVDFYIIQSGSSNLTNPLFHADAVNNSIGIGILGTSVDKLTVEGSIRSTVSLTSSLLNIDNIRIDGNTISSTNTNGNIIIDTNGSGVLDVKDGFVVTGSSRFGASVISDVSISSPSFASGFAGNGWNIRDVSGKYELDLDNLTVRGSMRVYELLINQIRATNGSIFVSSTGKVKTATLSSGTIGVVNSVYNFTTDTDTNHGFLVNDIIRAQRFTGNSVYQIDMYVTNVPNTTTFTASLQRTEAYIDDISKFIDVEFVRIGNTTNISRQGSVYMTADDSNAPFIDIVDGVNSTSSWGTTAVLKARLGNLTGIVDAEIGQTISGYGLYSENVFLKGAIVAKSGSIGGWLIGVNSITKNNVTLNSANNFISLGSGASMSTTGIYLSGSGHYNLQGGTNDYIRYNSSGFTLSATEFSLSGSTRFRLNTHRFEMGQGANSGLSLTTGTSNGIILSSSGEFLMGAPTGNRMSLVGGTLTISSSVFNLLVGTTLRLSSDLGGLFTLGGTGTTYALSNVAFSGSGIGKFGSVLIDGNTGGRIYVGTGTYNNTNTGFFLSGSGQFSLKNSFSWDGTNLLVSGSTTRILTPEFFLGGALNYISGSNGTLAIRSQDFVLSASSTLILNTTKLALGASANTQTITSDTGILLSSSGDFNLAYNSDNYIRRSGASFTVRATDAVISGSSVTIGANTFNLSVGNTLNITSTVGGLITLGGTGATYALSNVALSGSGIGKFGSINIDGNNGGRIYVGIGSFDSDTTPLFMSGSGHFSLKKAFTWNGTNLVVSGSTARILTPEFFLGGALNYISGSNGTLSIRSQDFILSASSTLVLDTLKFALGMSANTQTITDGSGVFMSASGQFRVGDTDEYVRFGNTTGTLEIKTPNFSIDASGNVEANNIVLDNTSTADIFMYRQLTITSANSGSHYQTVTNVGDGLPYTRLLLHETSSHFIRINVAPPYPIAYIKLPNSNNTQIIIEPATSGVKISALKAEPTGTGSISWNMRERIFYDSHNWASNLYQTDGSYGQTFTGRSGVRYEFYTNQSDIKLQTATSFDRMKLIDVTADDLFVTNVYAQNLFASSSTAIVYANQILASSSIGSLQQNRVATWDSNGVLSWSTISTTTLGYLSGVSSNIQSQLDGKVSTARNLTFNTSNFLTSDNTTQNLSADRTWNFSITTASLSGTTNQVSISGSGRILGSNLTISLPQDIHTDATPTFDKLTLGTTNAEPHLMFNRDGYNYIQVGGASGTLAILTAGRGASDVNATVVFQADKTTDFKGNVLLANQASSTTHPVRADRIITINGTTNQINTSATSQNLTSDRTWTLSLPQNIHTDANVQFDSARLDNASQTVNIDTYQQQAIWTTAIATSTSSGTAPTANSGQYYFFANLGGVGNGQGLQFATHYGGNDNLYFIRRRSDNVSSPNGANVWQPWRRMALEDVGGTLSISANATATNHAVLGGRSITLNGTTNQVNVSATTQNLTSDRTWTISLPQNIHTGATPTFGRLTLSQTTGTSPFVITSTTLNTNLNADLLDGLHASSFIQDGGGQANEVAVWSTDNALSGSSALTWNNGILSINGTLEASVKSFNIPHPTKENKRLIYGVVEAPEHSVFVRGKVTTNVIELPEEWTGLVHEDSITVQLTPIGTIQKLIVQKIQDNKVYIKNKNWFNKTINAYYFVQAERKDVAKLIIERDV